MMKYDETSATNLIFDIDRIVSTLGMPKFSRRLSVKDNLKRAAKALMTADNSSNALGYRGSCALLSVSHVMCTMAARSGHPVIAAYLSCARNVLAEYAIARGVDKLFSFSSTPNQRVWYNIQHTELVGTKYENIPVTKINLVNRAIVAASSREKNFLFRFGDSDVPMDVVHNGKTYKVRPVATNIEECIPVNAALIRITSKREYEGSFDPYVCVQVGDSFIAFVMSLDSPVHYESSNPPAPGTEEYNRMMQQAEIMRNGMSEPRPISVIIANMGEEKIPEDLPATIMMSITRKFLDTKKFVYSFTENGALNPQKRAVVDYKPLPEKFNAYIKSFRTMFDKGLHRGICFIGSPGCGKSTLMRQISDRFPEYMTIRLEPDMLDRPQALRNMYEFIRVMRNVIILCDDLDGWVKKDNAKDRHISKWIEVFDRLNELHTSDKVSYLFCCTMNDPSVVNSTIIRRSGRIDEVETIGKLTREQLNYLLPTYDAAVNGQSKTDFTAPEFDEVKDAVITRNLTPADIYNIFSHVAIDGTFTGTYTPEMLKETFNVIDQRNAASHTNFLDDGCGGQPGFGNGFPKMGQDSPYNLPIKHATLGVDTPFPGQMQ